MQTNDSAVPVMMAVARADGGTDTVRIGFAVRRPEGFELHLGQMFIAAEEPIAVSEVPRAAIARQALSAPRPLAPSRRPAALGADASIDDLEYLAERSRKALADPKKAKWHADEQTLLNAIEAELQRKRTATHLVAAVP